MRGKELIYILVTTWLIFGNVAVISAQKYPERSDIRKGNREYNKGWFGDSETRYRRAIEQNPESFEASYNLGNSLYKQGKWEAAEEVFSETSKAETSKENRFNSHFNAGNSMFQQRKLQEALEEYKSALRLNPNDMEAKYNLAYVKKLLEDEDGEGDGDDENDNNDDDQDDNDGDGQGDGNDNQGENDPDDNEGENNPDEGGGEDKPDDGDSQPKERPSGMTREEAENLLDAMQSNEDRAKEKADEKKAAVPVSSDKNW